MFAGMTVRRDALRVDTFPTPSAFRGYFKTQYGPTIAIYRTLAEDPDPVAELDRALDQLADRHDRGDGVMEWEYLLVTGRRDPRLVNGVRSQVSTMS